MHSVNCSKSSCANLTYLFNLTESKSSQAISFPAHMCNCELVVSYESSIAVRVAGQGEERDRSQVGLRRGGGRGGTRVNRVGRALGGGVSTYCHIHVGSRIRTEQHFGRGGSPFRIYSCCRGVTCTRLVLDEFYNPVRCGNRLQLRSFKQL